MFAAMKKGWAEIEEVIEETTEMLNGKNLKFDKTFPLKCMLVAHGRGAEASPEKFAGGAGEKLLDEMNAGWSRVSAIAGLRGYGKSWRRRSIRKWPRKQHEMGQLHYPRVAADAAGSRFIHGTNSVAYTLSQGHGLSLKFPHWRSTDNSRSAEDMAAIGDQLVSATWRGAARRTNM